MHQEKNWELSRQEQVGKQINVSVLLLINEVELNIYRFITLGTNKTKKQSHPIELGVDWFTSYLEHLILDIWLLPSTRPLQEVD